MPIGWILQKYLGHQTCCDDVGLEIGEGFSLFFNFFWFARVCELVDIIGYYCHLALVSDKCAF